MPQLLRVVIDDKLVIALGQPSATAAEEHVRVLLAVALYQRGELTLGQAAKICEQPKLRFMATITSLGVPVIDLDDDELKDELRFG